MRIYCIGDHKDTGNIHSEFTETGMAFEFHTVATLEEAIELADDSEDVICYADALDLKIWE